MTTPTPRTNAAQQEIDRRAFRRGRVHAPDVFDMADFARQLERELAAAQERAQAAEARVEAYRTNAKLLCAGFEDGKAVYWVHGRPGMFFDALECLDAAIAEGKK